jgi:predicted DNA-binding transcriptional regulator AlpA
MYPDATMTKLIDTGEVASMCGVHADTVKRWRARNTGPAWIRVGDRLVRYDPDDVRRWLAGSRSSSSNSARDSPREPR